MRRIQTARASTRALPGNAQRTVASTHSTAPCSAEPPRTARSESYERTGRCSNDSVGGTAHTQAPSANQHTCEYSQYPNGRGLRTGSTVGHAARCMRYPCAFRCCGTRILPSVRCLAAGSLCTRHWCTACRPACPRGLSTASLPKPQRSACSAAAQTPIHTVRCAGRLCSRRKPA